MIKTIRPLWFIDIIGTEQWLSDMSEKGLQLSDFRAFPAVFTFEEGEKVRCRYRLCTQKNCHGNAPKGLTNSGWINVCGDKNHYIVKNPDVNVKKVPSYENEKLLNRIVMLIPIFVCCYLMGYTGGYFISLGERLMSMAKNNGASEADMPVILPPNVIAVLITFAVMIALCVWIARINRRLAKTDEDLNLSGKVAKTIPKENFIYTPEEEKTMLKSGKMIKKTRFLWYTAPDKIEHFVEKMATDGWKFYRMSEMGNSFYFIKSDPCSIRFVVDYQNHATDEYFLSAKDDGWKLEFTSMTRLQSFIIWSKEYTGEEMPEFYSDDEYKLSRAKRMAFSIGGVFLFGLAVFTWLGIMFITDHKDGESSAIMLAAEYLIIAALYGYISFNCIGYYIRVRKEHKNR